LIRFDIGLDRLDFRLRLGLILYLQRARLNPGSWGGDIQIKGDTYLYGSNPWGHYKVGANGMITWTGGGYSSATLGRYIVENGTPEIVIGWADVDTGKVCKP
jgi:hypothetical protein